MEDKNYYKDRYSDDIYHDDDGNEYRRVWRQCGGYVYISTDYIPRGQTFYEHENGWPDNPAPVHLPAGISLSEIIEQAPDLPYQSIDTPYRFKSKRRKRKKKKEDEE